ncbi:hypothetical protein CEXT_643211 [Caerostris extrusa]|uniref:Uncharacterized protein n=1 Tax=Caerostris extrusa TaxID=172846 RepID=A0AAV4SYB2_CAEEX|nr:hypothetical protein CEXT_643211 [Caerostris extrusa]
MRLNLKKNIITVAWNQVMEAVAPLTVLRRQNSIPRCRVQVKPQPRDSVTNCVTPQSKTNLCRTSENVPVCYHYGRPDGNRWMDG